MPTVEIDLLAIKRGAVTAPAGCGKTQLVADALRRHDSRKPILVLTHTNAGVAALRGRLERAGVPSSHYRLATLDGFAIRLISTFPRRSAHDPEILKIARPQQDYPAIRSAVLTLLSGGHLNDVLPASYAGVIVDEYQDCNIEQHSMTVFAAEVLPVCVLGDPMQAIFNFGNNRLVDWDADVTAAFKPSGELSTPWRWNNANEQAFGEWVLEARRNLLAEEPIDLSRAPPNVVHVHLDGANDHALRMQACRVKAPTADGCVLIIADSKNPQEHRRIARQTPGAVVAENVDMRDLVTFAERLSLTSDDALETVVRFGAELMTNIGPDDLLARVASLRSGRARRAASDTEQAAMEFAARPSYSGASSLLASMSRDAGVRTVRPPLLRGCHKVLHLCAPLGGPSAYDAAVQVRDQARLIGRPLTPRTVGSTLLLKGLEADVSVLLNPELMDARHLYVAITRGARRLVVCSNTPILRPT